ncbi:MAG: ATP-dependent helicase [Proteobacteria bacterium]|nr:MAG: ATP-dependent helicase [Pseudomonadota bacterium]
MKDFFATDGPLAVSMPGYEPRLDQVRMAEAVETLLEAPERGIPGEPGSAKILLVEAETGIGKSLAYLVPAILSGKRVVVSTATINLQDQLVEKELPLLVSLLDEDIPVVCVKGRQNYLCHYRWYQYRSSPQLSLVDDDQADRVAQWLTETETGDRAELDWLPDRSPLWPMISAQSYQCLGSDCPESACCFVNNLRRKAASARILVVNHHLYFSDLALKKGGYGELLPRHEVVIFDEAHHLEDVATSFFGKSISQFQIYDLLSDISLQAESDLIPADADRLIGLCGGFKQRVEQFAALFPTKRGRYHLDQFVQTVEDWSQQVELLAAGLKRLADEAGRCEAQGDIWRIIGERALELRSNLLFAGLPNAEDRTDDYVYWYERRQRAVTLSATPITIAEALKSTLYATVPYCLLTSATLSSGNRFDYIRQRLGLDKEITLLQLKSPFNYDDQTILYIPEDQFPEPAAVTYDEKMCGRIEQLLHLSRGRALVLFTSFRGMDLVAGYLKDRLSQKILVQGDASRSRLIDVFRTETDSVLLAVASFWEGVDVPGEALCSVIIDKLPFEVPSDPVVQARMQAIDKAGGNPFFDFQVPRAILALRQGVGRLVRSSTDYGMIAIMDVRLFSKRYGNMFLKSMPPSPVAREIDQVAAFFSERNGANREKK